MTSFRLTGLLCAGLAVSDGGGAGARRLAPPAVPTRAFSAVVQPNPNIEPAGVLRDGVLAVTLEARQSLWYLDGPHRPAITIEAFSEPGHPPLMPGPLLRVPVGTTVRLAIRNSLSRPLTFEVPAALPDAEGQTGAVDSIVIAPGAVETLVERADVPGTYLYRAETPLASGKLIPLSGLLAGAIVVDVADAAARPDRVFVIMATNDSAQSACVDTVESKNPGRSCAGERLHYTINGESWPATERLHAIVGDSLRWRVVNATGLPHPMHLHGFYFRVDSYANHELTGGARIPVATLPGQMVVTQLMAAWSAMAITWSPDRAGNWLFHCHTAMHTTPPDTMASPDDPSLRAMTGLVLGTIVAPRSGVVSAGERSPVRRLRLVAEQAPGVPGRGSPWGKALRDSLPAMRFVLEEHGRRTDTHTDLSPQLDLVRGEPVAITIVNHLDEATSVHWHGIELEDSYMDGAAGFSGSGTHLTPAIAPGDSFVARFTPLRAGTFMYHAHVDDLREQLAGLDGALVVRDPGVPATDDHVFFFKGFRLARGHTLEINGQTNPDTVVLRAGYTARLRFMNLSMNVPSPTFFLTAREDSVTEIGRDTMLVSWSPVAKDGFDLPAAARHSRPAEQIVAMGETWDVELTPGHRGALALEVRETSAKHQLMVRVPIRIE